MKFRSTLALALCVPALVLPASVAASAAAPSTPGAAGASKARPAAAAGIRASATNVAAGDKYSLKVSVKRPGTAKRIFLQAKEGSRWVTVANQRGKSRRAYAFSRTASGFGTLQFRARVDRAKGPDTVTKTAQVNRWDWVDVSDVTSSFVGGMDYDDGGTWTTPFSTYEVAAREYEGIGSYVPVRSWSVGLHVNGRCSRVTGFAALDDNSDFGATGTLTVGTPSGTLATYAGLALGSPQSSDIAFPAESFRLIFAGSAPDDSIDTISFFGDAKLLCDHPFTD